MHLSDSKTMTQNPAPSQTLSARQQAIVFTAGLAAAGEVSRLGPALERGLDSGLTVSDAKEVLVQLYAYAGFPRSLNALGELMKVVTARKQRGIEDAQGQEPSRPIPKGDALLAIGTANQTKLVGNPVSGPLFEFAPVANDYLRTHLFGDIFERDNLDWQSREMATVGMLSALQGVDSQLQSHMGISINVGVTVAQLNHLAQVLEEHVGPEAAERSRAALARRLDAKA
jgi:4-carboxymuconolactone decarboxylase